jgi:hypothetical protein
VTDRQTSGTQRFFGNALVLLGMLSLILLPLGFYYLDGLACGMGTTGCANYRFPWGEAVEVLALPMIVSLAVVCAGLWLRRARP